MKIISLGYTCYLKLLIKLTKYDDQTNVFDWINSFYFKYLIECIEHNCDIFDCIEKSKFDIDRDSNKNIWYNPKYHFRLPHEISLTESTITYKRRFDRFIDYKNKNDNYLFIRIVNFTGRYHVSPEIISENYSDQQYFKLVKFLPKNNKILLLITQIVSDDIKSQFSKHFILVDDVINPEYVTYGKYLDQKKMIVDQYSKCFDYIKNNFQSLNVNNIKKFISNDLLK